MRDAEIIELAMHRVAAMSDCDVLSPSEVLERVAFQIAAIIAAAPSPPLSAEER